MKDGILRKAEVRFGTWQRSMVFEKKRYKLRADKGDSERAIVRRRQEILTNAVQGGPWLLGRYLRDELGVGRDATIGALPLTRSALTVNEYLTPPVELEAELGRSWADKVRPRRASKSVFWLLCHIVWIEQGRLGTGDLSDCLLNGPGKGTSEQQTRNFLRRTGGIYIRGKTSPLSDCTLARAWWRYHLSCEVTEASEGRISREMAHRVLHVNRPAWETLVTDSLRRLVALNHPRARAAMVVQLVNKFNTDGRIRKEHVRHIGVALARIGLRNSLGHVSYATLADAAERAMRSQD